MNMPQEEQEFNNFMKELSAKAMELQEKYDRLSEDNKRKVYLYFEPLARAYGTASFMEQMNILFPKIL